jgi:hypothetical protein
VQLDWRKVVATILAIVAAKGGWFGAAAALITQYLLPLINPNEKLSFATKTAAADAGAPPEFKEAVRKYLDSLIGRIKNPFIRGLAHNIVVNISDAILDAAYNVVVGGAPAPHPDSVRAAPEGAPGDERDLAKMAVGEVHAVAKEHGAKL